MNRKFEVSQRIAGVPNVAAGRFKKAGFVRQELANCLAKLFPGGDTHHPA